MTDSPASQGNVQRVKGAHRAPKPRQQPAIKKQAIKRAHKLKKNN